MKMLRWSAGVTRKDKIRNETIREKFKVISIDKKIQAARLTWYGHVQRRGDEYAGKRADRTKAETKKTKGRPPMTWAQRLQNDLKELQIDPGDVHDRKRWRTLTKAIDPK